MPDITKCKDEECPIKDMCFRYTSEPSERQAYFTESPRKDKECEMFWGDAQRLLMEQLQKIVSGKDTKSKSS